MHTHHHHSQPSAGSTGPAWFYGYCHDSGQMKMMTYPEYMGNVQTTYSKTMNNPGWAMQQWGDTIQGQKGSHARRSGCGSSVQRSRIGRDRSLPQIHGAGEPVPAGFGRRLVLPFAGLGRAGNRARSHLKRTICSFL